MRLTVRPLILAAALAAGVLAAVPASAAVIGSAPPSAAAPSVASLCPDAASATFGPNVCVFPDTMSQAAIQADLNAIATQQVPIGSQFDSQRYAVFFEPGTATPAYAPPVLDAYGAGCANSAEIWSSSQASPMRRVIINGSVAGAVEHGLLRSPGRARRRLHRSVRAEHRAGGQPGHR